MRVGVDMFSYSSFRRMLVRGVRDHPSQCIFAPHEDVGDAHLADGRGDGRELGRPFFIVLVGYGVVVASPMTRITGVDHPLVAHVALLGLLGRAAAHSRIDSRPVPFILIAWARVRVRVKKTTHRTGAPFAGVPAVAGGVGALRAPDLAQAEAPELDLGDVRLEGPVRPQGQSVDEPPGPAPLFGEHHEALRRLGASRKIERARALCRSQLVDLARRGECRGERAREEGPAHGLTLQEMQYFWVITEI